MCIRTAIINRRLPHIFVFIKRVNEYGRHEHNFINIHITEKA